MKKLLFLMLTMGILIFETGYAQENNDTLSDAGQNDAGDYKSILKSAFDDFETASSMMEMQSSGNKLGLIAKKWTGEWTAQYYAGYSLTVLSYIEKDEKKRDAYLDEADKLFEKASALAGNDNVEIYVLGAMIANSRIAVKPASRFQQYGAIFNSNLTKAKSLNSDNPRIYFLQGTSVYYTPKAFGGGAKNAIIYFEKADTLYNKEKNDDILIPYWGRKQNTEFLSNCRTEIQ